MNGIGWKGIPVVLLLVCLGQAQVHLQGSYRSAVYFWQPGGSGRYSDVYQGFRFRLRSEAMPRWSAQGFFRVALLGTDKRLQDRFYHLYVQWRHRTGKWQLRVGRQFLFAGVWNGTYDGAVLSARASRSVQLRLLVGVRAPYERGMRWNAPEQGVSIGAFATWDASSKVRFTFSGVHQQKKGMVLWQLLGLGISGRLRTGLHVTTNLEYNVPTHSVQLFRQLVTYDRGAWQLGLEFNHQTPRILENSYFRIFKIRGYRQIRSSVGYRLPQALISLQYLYTWYRRDRNHQVIVGVNRRWGNVGLVFQDGFGGNNVGIYGDVQYTLGGKVTLRAHSSYYNYQRYAMEMGEEAAAYAVGMTYRPVSGLRLEGDLQQSINSFYINDLRILLRLMYRFRW